MDTNSAEADAVSQARGVAWWVVIATLVVVIGGWLTWSPAPQSLPAPVCAVPVTVVEATGERLGCSDEADLVACGPWVAGDRAVLRAGHCERDVGGMSARARLVLGLPLDLNRVSAAELELLEGVGPKLASAIVAYRDAHGAFSDLAALDAVPGIGPATLSRLLPLLAVVAPRPEGAAP